jgi:broad specificity phosphatase PhoE
VRDIARREFLFAITGTIVATGAFAANSGPSVVMVIRHGEDTGIAPHDFHLSPRGRQRAEALPKLFGSRLPKPQVIIATRATKGSNRPVETVEPLARALDVPIDNRYAESDYKLLARDLMTDPRYAGKVVLVCWHHGKLPRLAKALGVKNVPLWPEDQFDRVWVIEPNGGSVRFDDVHQKLLDGDR